MTLSALDREIVEGSISKVDLADSEMVEKLIKIHEQGIAENEWRGAYEGRAIEMRRYAIELLRGGSV